MDQTLFIAVHEVLGPQLRVARKDLGLTQAQVAKAMQLSQARISEIENDPGSLTISQLVRLTAILKLAVLVGPRSVTTRRPPGAPEW